MKKLQVAKQFQIMRSIQKGTETSYIPNITCGRFLLKKVGRIVRAAEESLNFNMLLLKIRGNMTF
jgi:hypothetical protein